MAVLAPDAVVSDRLIAGDHLKELPVAEGPELLALDDGIPVRVIHIQVQMKLSL